MSGNCVYQRVVQNESDHTHSTGLGVAFRLVGPRQAPKGLEV